MMGYGGLNDHNGEFGVTNVTRNIFAKHSEVFFRRSSMLKAYARNISGKNEQDFLEKKAPKVHSN